MSQITKGIANDLRNVMESIIETLMSTDTDYAYRNVAQVLRNIDMRLSIMRSRADLAVTNSTDDVDMIFALRNLNKILTTQSKIYKLVLALDDEIIDELKGVE